MGPMNEFRYDAIQQFRIGRDPAPECEVIQGLRIMANPTAVNVRQSNRPESAAVQQHRAKNKQIISDDWQHWGADKKITQMEDCDSTAPG